jgi:hypothetical protein
VTRHNDEFDARACHIALTEAGRAQLASIELQHAELLGAALRELPADELERLAATLRSLEAALHSTVRHPVPPHRTPLAPSLVGQPHVGALPFPELDVAGLVPTEPGAAEPHVTEPHAADPHRTHESR